MTTPVAAAVNVVALALPVVSTMVAEAAADKLKARYEFPQAPRHDHAGPVAKVSPRARTPLIRRSVRFVRGDLRSNVRFVRMNESR